jgi:uncharacterized membrane protein YjdF
MPGLFIVIFVFVAFFVKFSVITQPIVLMPLFVIVFIVQARFTLRRVVLIELHWVSHYLPEHLDDLLIVTRKPFGDLKWCEAVAYSPQVCICFFAKEEFAQLPPLSNRLQ